MYLTISNKLFIPGFYSLFTFIHQGISHMSIISWWEISRPSSRLNVDLKLMPRSNKGHRYTLGIIDEVTNYMITVSIHQSQSEEIGGALIENVITKYWVPDYIIMDQDSTSMPSLMNYLFKKLDININTQISYDHQLLQAAHGIKSFSTILTKHLTSLGQMLPKYLPLATFTYNTLILET